MKRSVYGVSFLACLAYSLCSISMTLSNKLILSNYKFHFPILLLLWQNSFTFLALYLFSSFGLVRVEPLRWSTVKIWLPLNFLFVLTLVTSLPSIQLLSVAMVTILKNFQTVAVTLGDNFFFGHHISRWTAVSILLMFGGSVVAGLNDLQFNLIGYLSMLLNCTFGASYALYMSRLNTQLKSSMSKAYYNNALALPFLIPLLLIFREVPLFGHKTELFWDLKFFLLLFYNGICGLLISGSTFWVVRVTSPTTYSIVGALNKIPLTILGFMFFDAPVNILGSISIAIGLGGGVVYALAKRREFLKADDNMLPEISKGIKVPTV
eukprot:TRINITY_DN789_c0_g1_i1.p1 TRINITY_DN789_c0_g1~~TRINITY_DN789_c0_g1_i1.p1  ORF type:complete len:322 (-),score=32.31 TRINITY_DN789_c0_g1_i1:5-970(-)